VRVLQAPRITGTVVITNATVITVKVEVSRLSRSRIIGEKWDSPCEQQSIPFPPRNLEVTP
jgi:hypothetical protein